MLLLLLLLLLLMLLWSLLFVVPLLILFKYNQINYNVGIAISLYNFDAYDDNNVEAF